MSSAESSTSQSVQVVPRLLSGDALDRGFASSRWVFLVLSLILVLAAFLRLWQAGESLWIDELHTSWVVSGKLGDVLPRAAMGNQSPLYFWGMWLLVQVTGQLEWTLRLPSLVAGIALPAALYGFVGQDFYLSKQNSGLAGNLSYSALAAALLAAIDPTCIFYAQEARPYAWVMLLSVVELALLRRLMEKPTFGRRMALLANSLVLFYLHYTTAIFLAGIVFLLPMLVRLTRSPYATRSLVIDLLSAAVLAAPGVMQLSIIFERRTNWAAFVDRPSWQALFTGVPFTLWALLGTAFVVLAVVVPSLRPGNALTRPSVSAGLRHTSPQTSVLWFCALAAATLLPLILSWIVTRLDAARVYHVRYLVALVPLAIAATCLATAWIPSRITQAAALIALTAWHLYDGGMIKQFVRDGRLVADRNENWQGAVKFINRQIPQSDTALLIVDSDLIESAETSNHHSHSQSEDLQYQSFPLRGIYQVAIDSSVITVFPDIVGAGRIATTWDPPQGRREVWAVIRGDESRAQRRISDLQHQSPFVVIVPYGRPVLTLSDHRRFGTVHVVRFACTHERPN